MMQFRNNCKFVLHNNKINIKKITKTDLWFNRYVEKEGQKYFKTKFWAIFLHFLNVAMDSKTLIGPKNNCENKIHTNFQFLTYNAFFQKKIRQKLNKTFNAYFEGVPVNNVALFTL